jgi:hypothetical protein
MTGSTEFAPGSALQALATVAEHAELVVDAPRIATELQPT